VATDHAKSAKSFFMPLGATELAFGKSAYQLSVYCSNLAAGCAVNGDLSGVVQNGICSPRNAMTSSHSHLIVDLGALPTVVSVVMVTWRGSEWWPEQCTDSGGTIVSFNPSVWGPGYSSDAGYGDVHDDTLGSADCRGQGDCDTKRNVSVRGTALKYAPSRRHHINCGGAIGRYLFRWQVNPSTYWSVREVAAWGYANNALTYEAISRASSLSPALDPSNQSMIPPSFFPTWHLSPTRTLFGHFSAVPSITATVNGLLALSVAPFAPVLRYETVNVKYEVFVSSGRTREFWSYCDWSKFATTQARGIEQQLFRCSSCRLVRCCWNEYWVFHRYDFQDACFVKS
jgi:hypothetical protein